MQLVLTCIGILIVIGGAFLWFGKAREDKGEANAEIKHEQAAAEQARARADRAEEILARGPSSLPERLALLQKRLSRRRGR